MQLNPGNDKAITVELSMRNPATGALSAVTTGTVSAFVATSDTGTTAAHANLNFTAVHIGGANGFTNGTWMVFMDGALLTPEVLSALPATLYLIVVKSGDIRAVVQLDNVAARYATVTD